MSLPRPTPARREIALGIVHASIGAIGLAGGLFVLAFRPGWIGAIFGIPAIQAWPVFLLLSIGILAPSLVGGLSLIQGHPRGRALISVVSILLLPVIPIGTALGIWALVILRRKRVAGPASGVTASAFQARREAYEADPQAIWTCRHLAPIEWASRLAGVRLTPVGESAVLILDPVFRPSLERLIKPDSPVRCIEVPAPERSLHDAPKPMLYCRACHSSLLFEEAGAASRSR